MSTIKVNNLVPPNTGETVSINGLNMPTDGPLSNRNLIINGAMQVAQRGTSFTGITNSAQFIADRFRLSTAFATFSGEQSSTAPSGFSNSIKIDCTTAGTPGIGTDENFLEHIIEAQDLQHLRYGESGAKPITLSFYVKSNKTGSYGVWFYAQDGSRQYVTTYSIQAIDTWEFKTLTVPGDVSGTINNDNGSGIFIRWYLGAGSTYAGTPTEAWEAVGVNRTTSLNLADSTSNEWLITGVQLEVGEKTTPFEHRSIADELARCQRYFQIVRGSIRNDYRSDQVARFGGSMNFFTEMRAGPIISTKTTVASQNITQPTFDAIGARGCMLSAVGSVTIGGTTAQQLVVEANCAAELT